MKTISTAVKLAVILCAFIAAIGCSGSPGDSAAVSMSIANNFHAPLYDGNVDTGFNPTVNNVVYSIAPLPDGKIIIAGEFTSADGQTRNGIARLNADGTLDSSFNANLDAGSIIHSIAVETDGTILIGGNLLYTGSSATLARLKSNGTLDAILATNGIGGRALAIQPDGKILANGPETDLLRLNPDGSLDTSFNSPTPTLVTNILVETDGKIVYRTVHNVVARVNPDGSLDKFLAPGEDVTTFAVQADGKIVIGGAIGYLSPLGQGLIRLNPDGTMDQSFKPDLGLDAYVISLTLQADGRIIVAGAVPQENALGVNFLAWLNPDGSTIKKVVVDKQIEFLSLQADGQILFAGRHFINYETFGDLGRVNNIEPALQELSASQDGSSITWMRGGASPEVWYVEFQQSSDKVNWGTLGAGTRIPGGWTLSGLSLPMHQNFSVRAIGLVTDLGPYGSSDYPVETTRLFYLPSGTPESAIESLKDAIAALPSSAFKNANMQQALENKLDAVLAALQTGNSNGAYNQLTHDILAKTDGCANTGCPDKNDWIIDCQSQGDIYPLVLAAIQSLQPCKPGGVPSRRR